MKYRQMIGSMLLVSMVTFTGCSMREEVPPLKVFTLEYVDLPSSERSYVKQNILKVAYPRSLKEKMTYKMHFSYADTDQGVYQNAQWSNTVPKLLQGNIIEALNRSGLFKAVVPDASSVEEDLYLESSIYDFSHHVRGNASYAVVSMRFSLIDSHTGKLLGTKEFTYKEPTPSTDAEGYVYATNRAVTKLVSDLSLWLRHR